MARLTLQLRTDPVTRKREVLIGYESDSDALPIEHEDDHRALVQKIIGAAPVGRVAENQGVLEVQAEAPAQGVEQKQ